MTAVPGVASAILHDYALAIGDRVEVELLVVGPAGISPGPRLVEGRVVGATSSVLVLDGRTSDARIPWRAIALIRLAVTAHPATT